MTTEPLPSAASAEHLTEALRRAGALGEGRVCSVTVESSRATILSRIIRLRLTFEDTVEAPSSLILKTGLPERVGAVWNGGSQEVAFYRQIAAATSARIVPRCFEAAWDEDTKAWHLLLEDLTDSHVIATTWPLPPTEQQCARILDAWARFHAQWWDDPRFGISIGTWPEAGAMEGYLKPFAKQFEIFRDRVGSRLPRERCELYVRFIDAAPRLLARHGSHRNLTIVHGDAHVWNCFLPRDSTRDDVRIFDWDGWHIDTASDDLAYMMAMHWYPDYRRQMERRFLDHYHRALVEHGVRGYERSALDEDYRLSALWQIRIPVWQEANGIPPLIWWNNLERCLMAVDDLGCRDLLD